LSPTPPISISADALVVLIGPAGSGKSTFAAGHFPTAAIVSSDAVRRARRIGGWSKARNDVFDEVKALVEPRLATGALTVVDATNTDWMRRSELIRSARRHGRAAVAIVFALPIDECLAQNRRRTDAVPGHTIRRQAAAIARDLDRLDLEGFSLVEVFRSSAEADAARVGIKKGPVARASRLF
jgi:protein phosphatase